MQNEVKYRTSLVSKSLPIKKQIFANYSNSAIKTIRNVFSDAQVYAQVLNPFLFGGELVKAGINPDDLTGWDAGNHIGGQTNNTCITRSLVLGVRLGF